MASFPVSSDLGDVGKPRQQAAGFLLVMSASAGPTHVTIPGEPRTLILGRDPRCDVRLDFERDLMVSRRHAQLQILDDGVYLRDLGSANGTWLNGARLDGTACLRDKDVICLGGPSGPSIVVHLSGDPDATITANAPWEIHAVPPSMRDVLQLIRDNQGILAPQQGAADAQTAPPPSYPELAPPCPPPMMAASPMMAPPPSGFPMSQRQASTLMSRSDALPALAESWLAVDAPLQLALGSTGLVRAVAIRDALQQALVRGALRQENQQVLAALLGPAVCMKLVPLCADDFEVRPLTPARQRVRKDKLAVWEWLLTANELGVDKLLLLTVTSQALRAGSRAGEALPSQQLRIQVTISGPPTGLLFPTSGLRKLLQAALRTDGDFEAFCLDHFPAVFHRFASGMDRVAKLNLLLALEKGQTIVEALHQEEPAIVAQHAERCALAGTPRQRTAPPSAFAAQAPPQPPAAYSHALPFIPPSDFPLANRAAPLRSQNTPRRVLPVLLVGLMLCIFSALAVLGFRLWSR